MSSEGEQEDAGGDSVLVAEFALGLLPAAEHQRAARLIAETPALGRELRLWRLRLAALDRDFAETAAPADALGRIEARLFPATANSGAATGAAKWWNTLGFWRGLAAACLVIAVGAVGYDLLPRAPLTGPELAAALEAEGSNVQFIAFYDQQAGTVRVASLSGEPVPDKDFELWAIKGTAAPQSMGVLPMGSRNIPMTTSLKQGFSQGTVLAVTLEQKGGSPTGVAQGPIVAKGIAMPI
jgi:anti-sigma-K factor RskA